MLLILEPVHLCLFPAQIKRSAILQKAVFVKNIEPLGVLGLFYSTSGQKSLNSKWPWFFTAISRKAVSTKSPDVTTRQSRKTTDTIRTFPN